MTKDLAIGPIHLGTVPAGSVVERSGAWCVNAYLPDGSAKRFTLQVTSKGLVPVVDHIPAIRLTAGKAD